MSSDPNKSAARERQRRRLERRDHIRRTPSQPPQIQVGEGDHRLPRIHIPGGRYLLLIPGGIAVFLAVIFVLGLINPPEVQSFPNAIWLDEDWTQTELSDALLADLVEMLRANEIGIVFGFVSSLRPDNTWIGAGETPFNDLQPSLRDFATRLKTAYPESEVYGWIEVQANVGEDGYRLDEEGVHTIVADLSRSVVSDLGFDGVFLDVKPLWTGDADYLTLLRTVRRRIGLDTPITVSVPPDLTPTGVDFELPSVIAPGTEWDEEYKQRVALQSDHLVVTAYHSYHDDPVNYIEWVAYQVEAYSSALDAIDSGSTILISLPNYPADLPAHDPNIESLSAALDGVNLARSRMAPLAEDETSVLQGVAIYADTDLTADDWRLYRAKWLAD